MPEQVQFDLESLTLGEVIAAEDASGLDISRLLATAGHRRALGVFVSRLRTSGSVPNWRELMSLRLVDASPGRLRSLPDSRSQTSSGSD